MDKEFIHSPYPRWISDYLNSRDQALNKQINNKFQVLEKEEQQVSHCTSCLPTVIG